ncbi:MAG TPA: hypothetical protein VFY93_17320 [Planctomycetota bacterium]|nr:hypothetical protein [Planctomycetota bacterium]
MKRALWVLLAVLPACCLPPRTEDASTPELAFQTFRGALARKEFDRAYEVLSDRLRGQIGVHSRAEFMDWGAVAGQKAVGAIRRAKACGPAERLPDGRMLLKVRVRWLFFGKDVRLLFAPVPVVRVYFQGSEGAAVYEHLDGLELVLEDGIIGVRLPPDVEKYVKEGVGGGRPRELRAGIEWFLDDYEMGHEERSE